jgi:hypothetical protein
MKDGLTAHSDPRFVTNCRALRRRRGYTWPGMGDLPHRRPRRGRGGAVCATSCSGWGSGERRSQTEKPEVASVEWRRRCRGGDVSFVVIGVVPRFDGEDPASTTQYRLLHDDFRGGAGPLPGGRRIRDGKLISGNRARQGAGCLVMLSPPGLTRDRRPRTSDSGGRHPRGSGCPDCAVAIPCSWAPGGRS